MHFRAHIFAIEINTLLAFDVTGPCEFRFVCECVMFAVSVFEKGVRDEIQIIA